MKEFGEGVREEKKTIKALLGWAAGPPLACISELSLQSVGGWLRSLRGVITHHTSRLPPDGLPQLQIKSRSFALSF